MKPELTEKDQETYDKIVALGEIDTMFEYGYKLGQRDQIKKDIVLFLKTWEKV